MRPNSHPSQRANQKERTRAAIVDATRELTRMGEDVTMPAVAKVARVSEATAYRYFPDLVTLLREAYAGLWPSARDALAPMAGSADPVERIGFATEFLLRRVLSYQGAVRAMISASITRPAWAATRPGRRFGLIDEALAPVTDSPNPEVFAQLKRDLAIVVSAEALFTLTDLCGLAPEEAIASAVHTARTITAALYRP
jgi:AcrR family transcriptional regulator